MNQGEIVFCRAEVFDIEVIWRLLHSDSRMRSEEYIREHLNRIYILTEGKRVLGVLCGIPRTGKAEVSWLVVHPLYPESIIAEIMIRNLQGIYSRFYEDPAHRFKSDKIIKRLLTVD